MPDIQAIALVKIPLVCGRVRGGFLCEPVAGLTDAITPQRQTLV